MNATPWLVALAIVVTVGFVTWTWFMRRWDEREARRTRDDMLH